MDNGRNRRSRVLEDGKKEYSGWKRRTERKPASSSKRELKRPCRYNGGNYWDNEYPKVNVNLADHAESKCGNK